MRRDAPRTSSLGVQFYQLWIQPQLSLKHNSCHHVWIFLLVWIFPIFIISSLAAMYSPVVVVNAVLQFKQPWNSSPCSECIAKCWFPMIKITSQVSIYKSFQNLFWAPKTQAHNTFHIPKDPLHCFPMLFSWVRKKPSYGTHFLSI